jgi:UDP-sugar pyrophosphorylase
VNPYADYLPAVPNGETIDFRSNQIDEVEQIGLEQLAHTGFVLVAGGLGERLGYPGIKVSIPIDLVTEQCYLQYYIEYILAFQQYAKAPKPLPLAIMTSEDTDAQTRKLLTRNAYFGMPKEQITIMRQEKVPCLINNSAHFALAGKGLEIETKPHGHGDVHTLFYLNNLHEKWYS